MIQTRKKATPPPFLPQTKKHAYPQTSHVFELLYQYHTQEIKEPNRLPSRPRFTMVRKLTNIKIDQVKELDPSIYKEAKKL